MTAGAACCLTLIPNGKRSMTATGKDQMALTKTVADVAEMH